MRVERTIQVAARFFPVSSLCSQGHILKVNFKKHINIVISYFGQIRRREVIGVEKKKNGQGAVLGGERLN